jgi:lysophospholipase L1-like esterase
MNKSKTERLRNLALLAITIVITLAVMEAALQILDLPRQPMKPNKIKDPVLVYKIPSDWPGVDKDGFRNRSIPAQADIVTLGDSHTYGLNADIDTNWPGHLARLTGHSVYNLGIGGYGPLQYYHLLGRALQLMPKFLVIGLYLPNDIKGVCHPYVQTDYWKKHAPQDGLDLSYCQKADFDDEERVSSKRSGMLQTAGGMIANSKIGVLVSVTARRLRAYLPKDREKNVVVSDALNDTIMSKSRLRVLRDSMDLKHPEIAHSLEITKTLISRMVSRGQENGVQTVVMVIPSKEFIFHGYLARAAQPLPEVYQQMVTSEASLRSAVLAWLSSQSIAYVDIAPAISEAVTKHAGIYPHDNDGHPLPAGYEVYAKALYSGFFAGQEPR